MLRTSFSKAGTLLVPQDAGGTVRDCIAHSGSTPGDLRQTTLSARNLSPGPSGPERTRFSKGASDAEITRQPDAGGPTRFVLGARCGQALHVRIAPHEDGVHYPIIDPGETRLLDGTDAAGDCRGLLRRTGDRGIEVMNREREPVTCARIVGIV